MKFNQGTANEVAKWVLIVLLLGLFGGGFLGFGVWMLLDGLLIGLLLVFFAVLWLYLMVAAFYPMAAVTLSNEGVSVRIFVRTKRYLWSEIVQVGVLRRARQYGHYYDFVLLPQTGVLRSGQDKLFVLKNQFRLIHLPYTADTVAYVRLHYGPLDFDDSNGRISQYTGS